MKLKDEKGNEFEFRGKGGTTIARFGYLCPSNPMPALEKGDWYLTNQGCALSWLDDHVDIKNRNNGHIIEIRKADGTVWRKSE